MMENCDYVVCYFKLLVLIAFLINILQYFFILILKKNFKIILILENWVTCTCFIKPEDLKKGKLTTT